MADDPGRYRIRRESRRAPWPHDNQAGCAKGSLPLASTLAQIKTVIMTHMHYDHAGNTELFPNARFHVQDCEMEYVTGRCMCHPLIRSSFEPDYVVSHGAQR